MHSNLSNYKYPIRFYILATFIPWIFWSIAGYMSHLTPASTSYVNLYSILGLIGLATPMLIAFLIIIKNKKLKQDLLNRFFNFREIKPLYIFLTLFLMLGSILLAQFISLMFGYSSSQFIITGSYTFTSGVFPVWFLLIIAPILEELGWHTYGTDVLRNRFNLFKTSMIFALYWGIWHILLSFINN
jgi:membrane protease YdiL (CAAX protease family)